jgi:hypothetical protein
MTNAEWFHNESKLDKPEPADNYKELAELVVRLTRIEMYQEALYRETKYACDTRI